MCLGAIYWARLDRLYFACTRADAARVGFDDDFLYRELPLPVSERSIPTEPLLRDEGWHVMQEWVAMPGKTPY